MNTFLQNALNTITTANGAKTHKSSLNACLDLFSMGIGSSNKEALIANALKEDPILAVKTILYLRDPRNGQGNKDIARAFHNLTLNSKNGITIVKLKKLIKHLPEVGSWKDVYNLYGFNKTIDKEIIRLVSEALDKGDNLCAKWLPRQSQFHKDFAKHLGLDLGVVRRWVADLTKVVETAMCDKQWHTINYEHVPSRANYVYSKAFLRNDNSRRSDFLAKAEAGKVSIKASVLYPHEISSKATSDKSMQALWNALPNYMEGSERFNILPIVDVSDSMTSRVAGSKTISCIDVAVGLGLYVAERNEGAYKDVVCTFHTTPQLSRITGTLAEKVKATKRLPWGGSTNLQRTFELLLQNSVGAKLEDLPKVILLISDMEFDQCDGGFQTNYNSIKAKYNAAGLTMPTIVFWRVNVLVPQQPVTMDTTGTILINGFSASILKHILAMDINSLRDITPMNMFLQTVAPKYPFVDDIIGK